MSTTLYRYVAGGHYIDALAIHGHARARHHYEHALTLHADVGATDADDVRAHLAAVDVQPDTDHHQDD